MNRPLAKIEIAEVTVDVDGVLFVRPNIPDVEDFEYIYRDASGVRWNRARRALCAYEPARWEHSRLLRHIRLALSREYGAELVLCPQTVWSNVAPESRKEMERNYELPWPNARAIQGAP